MIEIGSLWEGGDREFIVTGLETKELGQFVFYKNIKTEQTYNCLTEAFLNRFHKIVNRNYKHGS